jgi:hypothetical protein
MAPSEAEHGIYQRYSSQRQQWYYNPSFAKIMLNQRKNAIVISEHLPVMDSFQVRALAEQLKAEIVDNDSNNCKDNNRMRMNWNVRVVIGYRRLYDFLPSRYSQMFKPKCKNQWASPWPGQGDGEAILPFDVENRRNFTEYFENKEKTSRHLSENVDVYYSLSRSDNDQSQLTPIILILWQ